MSAAEQAKTAGIRVFTVGIGRAEGAPIPTEDGGFRRDARGELVLSKLDERALQSIASLTGGTYVRSVTGDVDLAAIYERGIKAELTERDLGMSRRKRWHARYQWLVAAAMLLLMADAALMIYARTRSSHA